MFGKRGAKSESILTLVEKHGYGEILRSNGNEMVIQDGKKVTSE